MTVNPSDPKVEGAEKPAPELFRTWFHKNVVKTAPDTGNPAHQ